MIANITVAKVKLDVTSIRCAAQDPAAGAVVLFEGCTRNNYNGQSVETLGYEAFVAMAELELESIRQEAMDLYKLNNCLIHHRLGEVPLMEAALVVACSAAHRKEAFDAAMWIVDQIKDHVPIWKREKYVDGTEAWVEDIHRHE